MMQRLERKAEFRSLKTIYSCISWVSREPESPIGSDSLEKQKKNRRIYYEELAHIIIEAEKPHDLMFAS